MYVTSISKQGLCIDEFVPSADRSSIVSIGGCDHLDALWRIGMTRTFGLQHTSWYPAYGEC